MREVANLGCRQRFNPQIRMRCSGGLATLFHAAHGPLSFVHAAVGAHGLHALRDFMHRLAFMAGRVEDHVELLSEERG